MKCRVCGGEAIVRLEYANLRLCRDHFISFFERRVERTIAKYRMLPRGAKVVVGISGGKDSSSLLHVLWKLREKLAIEVVALTIDLGIGGYSERYIEAVKRLCRGIGAPLHVIDLVEECGFTMDDVVKVLRRSPCSACGVIKRYLLNKAAKELGAYAVATGHNLDDTLTALLQACVRGDVLSLAKIKPVLPPGNGFVARVKPLVETPESDVKLYADLAGIAYTDAKCPYSRGATSLTIKAAIDLLERQHPSIKFQLLRSFFEKIQPALREGGETELKACSECGEPSSAQICQFCRIRRRVLERASLKREASPLSGRAQRYRLESPRECALREALGLADSDLLSADVR